jgi:hypothetical protein
MKMCSLLEITKQGLTEGAILPQWAPISSFQTSKTLMMDVHMYICIGIHSSHTKLITNEAMTNSRRSM